MTVVPPPWAIVSIPGQRAEGAGRTIGGTFPLCLQRPDGRVGGCGGRRDGRSRDRDGGLLVVVAGQQDAGAGEERGAERVERDAEEGVVRRGPRAGNGFRVDRHGGLLWPVAGVPADADDVMDGAGLAGGG